MKCVFYNADIFTHSVSDLENNIGLPMFIPFTMRETVYHHLSTMRGLSGWAKMFESNDMDCLNLCIYNNYYHIIKIMANL